MSNISVIPPPYTHHTKMQPLTSVQLKKLEKLAKVIDGGDIALLTQINEIDERLDLVAEQLPALREARDGEVGPRGERGEKGDRGERGTDGKDGRDGVDGKDGADGKDGLNGKDGRDGVDGKDGADGFVDEATIAYLEDEIKRVEASIPEAVEQKETNFGFVIRDVVAGTGVTIDKRDPHRPVVSATGGPAGSGITRTIVVTSGNTTLGATASTDYACLVNGAHTITMPTAVGNTNKYTIKNIHTSDIIVNTTSSQTIDGTTTITIAPEDSVDLVSNNSNWYVI